MSYADWLDLLVKVVTVLGLILTWLKANASVVKTDEGNRVVTHLSVLVNDRLTQLLRAKDEAAAAKVDAAHALGVISGAAGEIARAASQPDPAVAAQTVLSAASKAEGVVTGTATAVAAELARNPGATP